MKYSEIVLKNNIKAKVGEMFSMFQKLIKRKPLSHRWYVKTKFPETTECISWNHLTREYNRSFTTRHPNPKLGKALPASAPPSVQLNRWH